MNKIDEKLFQKIWDAATENLTQHEKVRYMQLMIGDASDVTVRTIRFALALKEQVGVNPLIAETIDQRLSELLPEFFPKDPLQVMSKMHDKGELTETQSDNAVNSL